MCVCDAPPEFPLAQGYVQTVFGTLQVKIAAKTTKIEIKYKIYNMRDWRIYGKWRVGGGGGSFFELGQPCITYVILRRIRNVVRICFGCACCMFLGAGGGALCGLGCPLRGVGIDWWWQEFRQGGGALEMVDMGLLGGCGIDGGWCEWCLV